MGDSISIVFSIIIAVVIMFFFPMLDNWERQDDLSYMAVYTATVDFVDAVRNTGGLTKNMYESFLSQINSTGNSYEVVLEHREYKVVPKDENDYEVVYLNHYSNEIEKDIYSPSTDYVHAFNKGDYFYVSVKNTNKTPATLMEEATYSSTVESFKIGVPYGGQIKSSYRQY